MYENNLYELTFENIKLMIKSMYGEYDSYNIEHRNYTVIQGKSESPLAKYIAENINRYANEYLKIAMDILKIQRMLPLNLLMMKMF